MKFLNHRGSRRLAIITGLALVMALGIMSFFSVANTVQAADPSPTAGAKHAKPADKDADKPGENQSEGRRDGEHGHRAVVGTVNTIDLPGKKFTLTTHKGEVVTITVMADTRFHMAHHKTASIADLKQGERVAVIFTRVNTALQAKMIQIMPAKGTKEDKDQDKAAKPQQFRGTVSTTSTATSLTITGPKNLPVTFVVNSATKFQNTANPVVKDTRVVVLASKGADGKLTALAVMAKQGQDKDGDKDEDDD